MKKIRLKTGESALVDDNDYMFLMQWAWYCDNGSYAARTVQAQGVHRSVRMHNILLPQLPGFVVDHKNGNPLDNRKLNLRHVTSEQNSHNSRPPRVRNKTSQFKGVSRNGPSYKKPWQAYFKHNGRRVVVGHFDSEIEAAKAYNTAILKHRGEFAWLNPV